jgi:hypothetical protein
MERAEKNHKESFKEEDIATLDMLIKGSQHFEVGLDEIITATDVFIKP